MREATGICRGAIGSTTHAERAQNALLRAAIRTRVVKVSSGQRNGCIYGIEIPCAQKQNAEEVLARQNIRIRSWITE